LIPPVLKPDDGDSHTDGVKTLMGDPRKAVIKLAIPMIVAMSVQTIYNFVDALWVSGLGADALSALGFFFPFLFMAMALSNGLGVGASSAISRRIGSRDKEGADNVAVHTIVIMAILAFAFSLPLYVLSEDIFRLIGAGRTLDMAVSYARVLFAGIIVLFFSNVANAILRGEGDAKRAMYAMVLGAGLNIVLDPVFIYTFGLGVAGAAAATVLSMGVTSLLLAYWLFLKADTYVSFSFSNFRFSGVILKDIFKVGLPSSVQQFSMSLTTLILNLILVKVGGTDGVAVYSTGWRVVTIAILPLLGIATAVVPVTGAAFGAAIYERLSLIYHYAIRIGLVLEIGIAVATFLLAPQIAALFTQAEGASRIAPDLITFLRIACLFYPGAAFGIMSSATFQGTGKGTYSLATTLIRTVFLTAPLAYLLAVYLDFGLTGVWWSFVTANTVGGVISFTWVELHIKHLRSSGHGPEAPSVPLDFPGSGKMEASPDDEA
jgi:putative MATE family efflux protein